jgi:Flp pilus assembly secretin CpaC
MRTSSGLRPFIACAALLSAIAAFALDPVAARPREAIMVSLDQAKLIRIPDRVNTIVIGNPLIADASVQSGGILVITGKGYGTTNIIALDRSGTPLMEREILVEGPRDVVVVYRGIERETYSCAPNCEPRTTLGDNAQFFTRNLTQSTTLSAQAQGVSLTAR